MPSLEPLFPVGFPHHLNRDRLLNDPVGNLLAKHGIGKDFAPVLEGKLCGHDGCKILDTSVHEIVYILKLLGSQCSESEIIDDKAAYRSQFLEKVQVAALGPGQGDLLEKAVEGEEEGREALSTGGLSQSTGQMSFADPGRTGDKDVSGLGDEGGGDHLADPTAIEFSIDGEIKIFEGGRDGEAGVPKTAGQPGILPVEPFVLQADVQELGRAPLLALQLLDPFWKGLVEAEELEFEQKIRGGVDKSHGNLL